MNLSDLPNNAFTDPTGDNLKDVQEMLDTVLRKVLAFSSNAESHDPLPEYNLWNRSFDLPEKPAAEDELMRLVESALHRSMNPLNSRYIGHMDSMPSTASQATDLVAAAINNNMLSAEMSPFFTRLEKELTSLLAAQFGLGDESGGVMTSGGSLANLQALTVARNVMLDTQSKGLHHHSGQPVILASEAAHTSLQKAAMIMGLGSDGVRSVRTDSKSKMDPDALKTILKEIGQTNQRPFCLVATAGTTTTGNIDPLPELAEIAKKHQLWLHVDAAYGGALIFSGQYNHLLKGIEQADSITFNPQKWMYVAKTSAMVLFRDMNLLHEQFQIGAPYMKQGNTVSNLGEISVQGTRHADVLKLWLTMHQIGKQGFGQLIDESYELTSHMRHQIEQRSFLELASDPEMNILCFRGKPDHLPENQWDNWNTKLNEYLLDKANFFLSLPTYRGHRWQRAVLLNPYTEKSHISELFEHIDYYLELSK